NNVFLPGIEVPREVEITNDLGAAISGANIVLGVMPSAHARTLYSKMLPHVSSEMSFVSATKGLDPSTLNRITQVISESFITKFPARVAALSGPSFAKEVAKGDPTAVAIASHDAELRQEVQNEFSGSTLRLYANDDPVGVELGGAVKNVIAIAAGV